MAAIEGFAGPAKAGPLFGLFTTGGVFAVGIENRGGKGAFYWRVILP